MAFHRKLVGGAYAIVGLKLLLDGLKQVMGKDEVVTNGRVAAKPAGIGKGITSGLLGESLAESVRRTSGVITKKTVMNAGTIENRLRVLKRLIREGSEDPEIRSRALAVLTRKCGTDGNRTFCVPEKNWGAEVRALFDAVKDPNSPVAIRYTRDHLEKDTFTAARKTLQLRGGDCDDSTVFLGAMLRSVGYPVKMRVVQAKNESTWSHIYLVVGLPPTNPTNWLPLDVTVDRPAGWEAGDDLVTRRMDFDV